MYTIKNKSFSKTFFPYCIGEWNNKLNPEIRNVESTINLKNQL